MGQFQVQFQVQVPALTRHSIKSGSATSNLLEIGEFISE